LGLHVPRWMPGRRSITTTRPKRRAGVGVVDVVASISSDGDAGAIPGASVAADTAIAQGPPELKNGGALQRAAIVPMVKLGCAPAAANELEGPA
jgi:hypothetical protein